MRRAFFLIGLGLVVAVGCGDDEDGTDSGVDSGRDAAGTDAGGTDGGGTDGGGTDGGGTDGGGTDGGGTDGGGADGSAADAGGTDGGAMDTGGPDAGGGGRTPVTGGCYRRFGACDNDTQCAPAGCGSESCSNDPGLITTCECTMPVDATCGCVDRMCTWYR